MRYEDEKLARIRYQNAAEEALCDVKPWVERSYLDYVEGAGGASILHILGEDPEAFLGLDAGKINRARAGRAQRAEDLAHLHHERPCGLEHRGRAHG